MHFTKIISPTSLTLTRGVFALLLPFFLIPEDPALHIVGIVLFTVGAITDFFDGWIARKYNLVSELGKILDPTTDKLLTLIPLIIFASWGYYSPWWLVPIFVREIAVTFCRVGWMNEGKAIAAERMGKWKFGLQVNLIGWSFFYMLSQEHSGMLGAAGVFAFLMWASLYSALILTVISGVSFFVNNRSLFKSEAFCKYMSAYGVGLFKWAPGTWGSALAIPLAFLVHWNPWLYLITFLILLWIGYWSVSGLDLTKEKDPGFVVVDEVLGIFVTFLFIPFNFVTVIAGFVLFRLFDILKPPPCRQLEKFPGYWGIVADDLMAGVYSWLILWFFLKG